MATRTFSRARAPFRRNFRRRPALNWQKADKPRKWQMGNFFTATTATVTNTSDITFNTAILLARTMNFGDLASSMGRQAGNMIRRVEIGGVVLNFGIFRTNGIDLTLNRAGSNGFVMHSLLVDRLTTSGAPVAAATTQWHRNTSPALQVSATLPASTDEDSDFPTRVLFRRTLPRSLIPVSAIGAGENTLEFSQLSPTTPGMHSLNKRLRLPLDDEHGLFLCFSYLNPVDYAAGADQTFRQWASGSIYYRIVYGR